MEDQALSRNFLSAIFGIFGIFWVEICGRFFRRNFVVRKKSIEKKSEKWIFETKKILWKSQWKMKILKFRFFSSKNQNFKIFIFHWLFHRKKIGFFLVSKNYFAKKYVFDRKKIRPKNVRRKFFRSHISIQKIIKIPKITLIKLFNEAWSSIQHLEKFASFPPPTIATNQCWLSIILWFNWQRIQFAGGGGARGPDWSDCFRSRDWITGSSPDCLAARWHGCLRRGFLITGGGGHPPGPGSH